MRLADWLAREGEKRGAFAQRVGCSATTISHLTADPPLIWIGKDLALRIREATGGLVTPNDFLPTYVARPAGDMPGEAADREGENLTPPAADLCPTIGEPA